MEPLYTAVAHATGDGRNGHTRTGDGMLDLELLVPTEMGGPGGATNPEQLFAAGYAACFHSALKVVAKRDKLFDVETGELLWQDQLRRRTSTHRCPTSTTAAGTSSPGQELGSQLGDAVVADALRGQTTEEGVG